MMQIGKIEAEEGVIRTYMSVLISSEGKISTESLKNCDSNGIKWLRTLIYNHRLPKLGELIQGILVFKFRKGSPSKDFVDIEFSCI